MGADYLLIMSSSEVSKDGVVKRRKHSNRDREIKIESSAVEVVEDFCYLGNYVTNSSSCDKDCQIRIAKANSVFGRLKQL